MCCLYFDRYTHAVTYQQLAERSPHHPPNVSLQGFLPLDHCAASPLGKYALASAVIDLFDVVVHVFDQQDVVVQHLLVLGIVCAALTSRRSVRAATRSTCSGRLFGNDFQAVEHAAVDSRVGVVDQSPDFRNTLALTIIVGACNGREDVLHSSAEMRENSHESDDTFALVDLDLCLLNRTDLVVDELGEESLQAHGQLVQKLQEILLCSIGEVERVLAERDEYTHALDGVRRHGPIEQLRRLLGEE